MKAIEYAKIKGLTLAQLSEEMQAFAMCEGWDEDGKEYETLDAWIDRRKRVVHDPEDEFDVPGNQ
mgnify:CR=1 FL=1